MRYGTGSTRQSHYDGGGSGEDDGQSVFLPQTGNSNLSIATALDLLGLDGSIDKAKSTVSGILNATVDSAATAVANNVAVSMAPTAC
jgi:hypothetical protein